MIISESTGQIPFNAFLNSLKDTLKSVFYERDNIEKFIQQRGFPAVFSFWPRGHQPVVGHTGQALPVFGSFNMIV